MFISNALFGSEARVFSWNEKSFLGTDSPIAWKSAGYKILYPVKIVLIGPMIPFVNFVRQDPDPLPPFVAAAFALYWSILALVIHYLLGKIFNSLLKVLYGEVRVVSPEPKKTDVFLIKNAELPAFLRQCHVWLNIVAE